MRITFYSMCIKTGVRISMYSCTVWKLQVTIIQQCISPKGHSMYFKCFLIENFMCEVMVTDKKTYTFCVAHMHLPLLLYCWVETIRNTDNCKEHKLTIVYNLQMFQAIFLLLQGTAAWQSGLVQGKHLVIWFLDTESKE